MAEPIRCIKCGAKLPDPIPDRCADCGADLSAPDAIYVPPPPPGPWRTSVHAVVFVLVTMTAGKLIGWWLGW